ncbi:MAG TPA: HEAT repeat domain-containing protein, partial [Vicinamibacterales bacterium]
MNRTFVRAIAGTLLAIGGAACASAPPRGPAAPVISFDQKMAWMLQLEDQRILRVSPPPPAPVVTPVRGKKAAPAPPAPPTPDLLQLIVDPEARVRRRAALAIGRVGLPEGVAPLQTALTDTDPAVRQMAAFGLGLIGDRSAVAGLTTALQDADPLVRGRAAEALGLIGDSSAGAAVGAMTAGYIKQGAIASLAPDEERWPLTPESDATRLGLFALVRLKAWEGLASAVLDSSGRPVSAWWPVAYALQRINDPRALGPLQQLVQGQGRYTRAFAARGLGRLKDPSSTPLLIALLRRERRDEALAVTSVRALAELNAQDAVAPLVDVLSADTTSPNLRLETVTALGALHAKAALAPVQDLATDEWPVMRAAALRAAAAIDPDAFLLMLSGMEPDPHWLVRAALADVLGSLPANVAIDRVRALVEDQDTRVIPAALGALERLKAPGLDGLLVKALGHADFSVRAAAARALGELKPEGGAAALRDAYQKGLADSTYEARDAALTALAGYGAAEATDTLKTALTDKDWPLRIRAAELLAKLDPSADVIHAIRPVPTPGAAPYSSPELLAPEYSPHAFIETAKGTIEIELTVLDAPQTTQNFMALARKGFFNGLQIHRVVLNFVIQDGDPRGDGEGGPGYTIRDELNDRPFVRGVVGMALSWRDTGGSQFFITHSPQPHLDAKYTVFGHVVNGMDVVDKIQQLDVIERVR